MTCAFDSGTLGKVPRRAGTTRRTARVSQEPYNLDWWLNNELS